MWETWAQSLGWEHPLEEGIATLSSILALRIPMDKGAWWATVHGVAKSWIQLKQLSTHASTKTWDKLDSACGATVCWLLVWKKE